MSDTAALPLYVQISEMLIREIAAGRRLDGERLPPEREMAGGLGISVGTLRKALADLAAKGLLERRQGSGNYIRQGSGAVGVYAFFRLELPDGGGLPTAEVVSVARRPKPADLPAFGASDAAHRIRRIRRLSGQPVALEEIWLDAGYVSRLSPADLSESLYLHYRERLGLWISRAEDRVGVGALPGWAGATVAPPGRICGHVERISWARDGARAEVSRTWFDHERARYVSRIR